MARQYSHARVARSRFATRVQKLNRLMQVAAVDAMGGAAICIEL
jgi:hypothetical protein